MTDGGGGVEFRSWNSNNTELHQLMANDNALVTHNSPDEKVLGYRYSIQEDTLVFANYELDAICNTKRSILSPISNVFEPLCTCLPINTTTMGSRIRVG